MTLADRIEERIQKISVTGGGYISFVQETLRSTISAQLLRKITEEAADEALSRPMGKGQTE